MWQGRSVVAEHGAAGGPDPQRAGSGRAGPIETMKAVMWSFFGVRGRAGYERDIERLNPVYVILTAIVLAALFVLSLIVLVRWVVA